MFQFDKIKLVIWDLDETFWTGTLSEGSVVIPPMHRQLVERLTDCGIVNAICSKNDEQPVKDLLEKEQLWQWFVFPSINWDPKGARIKQLIEDMQLRAPNVLFIDDNPSNLGEAQHFCPGLMTATPDEIASLFEAVQAATAKDPTHKRLAQYRVLETKREAKKGSASNEAFLAESDIRVTISHDCENEVARIHDLILRSNQLNFTKVRSSEEELREILADKTVESGYVSVCDRFGDYGIVGFYALRESELVHFTFSCRTLGMGIEQYVYNLLGRPTLHIVGDVVSDLSMTELPSWINQEGEKRGQGGQMKIEGLGKSEVLIKGPCDLFQVFPYIADTDLFDTEFTYTVGNLTIESTGHTTHIVEALRLSDEQKQRVISELPFTDMGMYCDNIFKKPYKVVFISILADANLGVYRRKETGERLAIMEYIHPLTDPESWDGILSGEYPHAGFDFTKEILEQFAAQYEFEGRNTPETIRDNLQYIREHLPKDCLLAVMLGGEMYYEKNTFEAYRDRHLVHREVNALLREWAQERDDVYLVDVNRYLVDQSSFYDHFNHYIKPVYYQLAQEMVEVVNRHTGRRVKSASKAKILLIRLKEIAAPVWYKVRRLIKK